MWKDDKKAVEIITGSIKENEILKKWEEGLLPGIAGLFLSPKSKIIETINLLEKKTEFKLLNKGYPTIYEEKSNIDIYEKFTTNTGTETLNIIPRPAMWWGLIFTVKNRISKLTSQAILIGKDGVVKTELPLETQDALQLYYYYNIFMIMDIIQEKSGNILTKMPDITPSYEPSIWGINKLFKKFYLSKEAKEYNILSLGELKNYIYDSLIKEPSNNDDLYNFRKLDMLDMDGEENLLLDPSPVVEEYGDEKGASDKATVAISKLQNIRIITSEDIALYYASAIRMLGYKPTHDLKEFRKEFNVDVEKSPEDIPRGFFNSNDYKSIEDAIFDGDKESKTKLLNFFNVDRVLSPRPQNVLEYCNMTDINFYKDNVDFFNFNNAFWTKDELIKWTGNKLSIENEYVEWVKRNIIEAGVLFKAPLDLTGDKQIFYDLLTHLSSSETMTTGGKGQVTAIKGFHFMCAYIIKLAWLLIFLRADDKKKVKKFIKKIGGFQVRNNAESRHTLGLAIDINHDNNVYIESLSNLEKILINTKLFTTTDKNYLNDFVTKPKGKEKLGDYIEGKSQPIKDFYKMAFWNIKELGRLNFIVSKNNSLSTLFEFKDNKLLYNFVAEVIPDTFIGLGFKWLDNFKGDYDPMHFEWFPDNFSKTNPLSQKQNIAKTAQLVKLIKNENFNDEKKAKVVNLLQYFISTWQSSDYFTRIRKGKVGSKIYPDESTLGYFFYPQSLKAMPPDKLADLSFELFKQHLKDVYIISDMVSEDLPAPKKDKTEQPTFTPAKIADIEIPKVTVDDKAISDAIRKGQEEYYKVATNVYEVDAETAKTLFTIKPKIWEKYIEQHEELLFNTPFVNIKNVEQGGEAQLGDLFHVIFYKKTTPILEMDATDGGRFGDRELAGFKSLTITSKTQGVGIMPLNEVVYEFEILNPQFLNNEEHPHSKFIVAISEPGRRVDIEYGWSNLRNPENTLTCEIVKQTQRIKEDGVISIRVEALNIFDQEFTRITNILRTPGKEQIKESLKTLGIDIDNTEAKEQIKLEKAILSGDQGQMLKLSGGAGKDNTLAAMVRMVSKNMVNILNVKKGEDEHYIEFGTAIDELSKTIIGVESKDKIVFKYGNLNSRAGVLAGQAINKIKIPRIVLRNIMQKRADQLSSQPIPNLVGTFFGFIQDILGSLDPLMYYIPSDNTLGEIFASRESGDSTFNKTLNILMGNAVPNFISKSKHKPIIPAIRFGAYGDLKEKKKGKEIIFFDIHKQFEMIKMKLGEDGKDQGSTQANAERLRKQTKIPVIQFGAVNSLAKDMGIETVYENDLVNIYVYDAFRRNKLNPSRATTAYKFNDNLSNVLIADMLPRVGNITLFGIPEFRAMGFTYIDAIYNVMSGIFYVLDVEHNLTPDDFKTTLNVLLAKDIVKQIAQD